LLIANGRGLIVNTGHYGRYLVLQGSIYGAQKAGADRWAADMAKSFVRLDVALYRSGWATSTPNDPVPTTQLCHNKCAIAFDGIAQFTGRVIAALYASQSACRCRVRR